MCRKQPSRRGPSLRKENVAFISRERECPGKNVFSSPGLLAQCVHCGARKSMLRCLSKRAAVAHAHSTQPVDGPKHAKVLPTLPPAAELVQPPLRANLPNAGIVRGGEHGSFTRGDEASSSMKGCSLCMWPARGQARQSVLYCVAEDKAMLEDKARSFI